MILISFFRWATLNNFKTSIFFVEHVLMAAFTDHCLSLCYYCFTSVFVLLLSNLQTGGFYLSFWSTVLKIYPFETLCWVYKDENMSPNKFSQPIGLYISHSYWKQIYCLKLEFPKQHLFGFSNNNSRINCKLHSKLTTEAPDVALMSLLLTLNIFNLLFQCFFADFEHVNAGWNTLLP